MQIRVLHVVTYMGRGGIETMLMNYYRKIDREKIQFDFLTHRSFEADYDKEIETLGGKIYRLPNLNPFSIKYLNALDSFFKAHPEYKIVHSHLDCMAGIPLKYAKKNGIPIRIAHAHNSNQVKDKKYLLKLLFKRNIPKYATKLLACSEEAGSWMFKREKFEVLYNAIDAKQYIFNKNVRNNIRKEMGIEPNTLVVGHVGRFAAQKNHTFLIDIFCEVIKKQPESKLMLVGEGPLKEEIEKKCKRNRIIDKVIFTGVRNDVANLMQAMDVFVVPSLFEGLGIVNIEAQAASLPCLISDKVPVECVKIGGLVKQIRLEANAEYWALQLLKFTSIERRNTFKDIKKAGFDVQENVKKLEKFYLEF